MRNVLPCEASGRPTPKVQWQKDGKPFPSTGLRHRTMPSGSLEFMLVRLEDDGDYTCIVSNTAGNASHTVTLQVQGQSAKGVGDGVGWGGVEWGWV